MPERNVIYRHDWVTETGVSFRFEITPPHQDALSSPTIVTLPDDFIISFGKLDMGYDKLPIGMLEFKSLTMRFNLSALVGTADLENLRTYLLTPVHAGQALIGPVGSGGVPNEPIDLYTWCSLYVASDKVFEGALRDMTTKKIVIAGAKTNDASVSLEVQWTHMAQVVMETLRTRVICKRMLENVNSGASMVGHKTVFDVIYRSGSSSTTWCAGQGLDGDNVPKCRLYTIASFFTEAFALLQQIYRKMVRVETATFDSYGSNGVSGETPLYNMKFFKQIYDGTTDRGAALTSGSECIIGRVWPANKPESMSNDVAGLFVGSEQGGGEQNSLYRFANFWDFIKVCCEGYFTRAIIGFSGGGIRITWTALLDTGLSFITIGDDDILPEDVEIEDASRTLSAVKVAVPGLEGDDAADYESVRVGVENEEDRNVRLLFHTLPKLGTVNERISRGKFLMMFIAAPGGNLPEIGDSYDPAGIFCKTFSLWSLYYLERPQKAGTYMAPGDIVIRCHSDVEINLRPATRLHNSVYDWTLHQSPRWPDPFRGTLLSAQMIDGFPQQVANVLLEVFGNKAMRLYKIKTLATTLKPYSVGERFRLGSGNTTDWITPDTFLNFSTIGYLVGMQLDLNTGIVDAEILYVPGVA